VPGAAEKLLRAYFLVSVMTQEEFELLKKLLSSSDLDQNDELRVRPAQFELLGNWAEKDAA